MGNLWNAKNSKLVALLIALTLVVTLMPATNAEAKTRKMNHKTLTIYEGKEAALYVKNATGRMLWTSSDESVATVTPDGKSSATVLAVASGSAIITATSKTKGTQYTCEITIKEPYITLNTDTITCRYEKVNSLANGERARVKLVGTDIVGMTASDPDILSFEYDDKQSNIGYITAEYATDEPVEVYVEGSNGKTYTCSIKTEMPYVARPITTLYTPDQDHYGMIEQREKKYEYIPELYYTIGDSITWEESIGIYKEAITHGTNDIYIRILKEEEGFPGHPDTEMFFESLVREGITTQCMTNGQTSALGHYFSQFENYINMQGYNTSEVIGDTLHIRLVYTTGQKIMYHSRLKGYPELAGDEIPVYNRCMKMIDNALAENNTVCDVLYSIQEQICNSMTYDKTDATYGGGLSKIADSRGIYQTTNTKVNDARGALLDGRGMCTAYADAYATCLTILGFHNYPVGNGGHEWNAVMLDGIRYYIDVCQADSYLDGRAVMREGIDVDPFMVTDDEYAKSIFWSWRCTPDNAIIIEW